MDIAGFRRWIDGYEWAWRSPGTARLAELFSADVVYRHSPYAEPVVGLDALGRDWQAQRAGPDEVFDMDVDVLAVNAEHADGPLGIAHLRVRYGDPVGQEYRDLWLVRFDGAGRACEFEEWPFWPGRGWSAAAE